MKNTTAQIETIVSSRSWLPISMLSTFNLQLLIKKMKHSHSWAMGELVSVVLLNNPKKQVVFAILHSCTEIVSFQSSYSIAFRVIEGRLKLKSKNNTVFIKKGSDFTLNEKGKYTLSNKKETAYLFTIINKDYS